MLNILLIYFILFITHYILYIFIETSSISSWKYIVYLKKTHELHPGSTSKAAENGLGDDISCRKSLIHGKLTITAHEKHLAWLIYDSWDEPPSMHFYIVLIYNNIHIYKYICCICISNYIYIYSNAKMEAPDFLISKTLRSLRTLDPDPKTVSHL